MDCSAAGAGRFLPAAVLAGLALLVLLVMSAPLTFWEYDELLFAAGVQRFEPLQHHPHPPGYPVFVALGKVFRLVTPDPFTALVAVSITASVLGCIVLALAFRNLLGADRPALLGALLFWLSPGVLLHASLPLSDAAALALLAWTVYAASRVARSAGVRDAALLGTAGSLTVGCRPQLAVLIVPLLLLTMLQDASWRRRGLVLASFGAVSLCWLLPLVIATGGLSGFLRYELQQASIVAANDADLARGGRSTADLLLHFLAHPWGSKVLSMPVLASAVAGFAAAVRWKETRLVPILGACGLYLAFALSTMDPADGVRYALPGSMATALLAARAWSGRGRAQWAAPLSAALLGLYAIGSLVYLAPVTRARHTSASPPVQAAQYAGAHLPANAVVMYDLSLKPHAQALLSGFQTAPAGPGFGEYAAQPHVPVFMLADGGTAAPGAVTFSWPESDAVRQADPESLPRRVARRSAAPVPLPGDRGDVSTRADARGRGVALAREERRACAARSRTENRHGPPHPAARLSGAVEHRHGLHRRSSARDGHRPALGADGDGRSAHGRPRHAARRKRAGPHSGSGRWAPSRPAEPRGDAGGNRAAARRGRALA